MFRGKVNLRFALVDQGDVHLDEELAARQRATLSETGLGLHGRGDGDPCVALLLGEEAVPAPKHRLHELAMSSVLYHPF
jgi:hypothetical protein